MVKQLAGLRQRISGQRCDEFGTECGNAEFVIDASELRWFRAA
jgi:hypothetical protein